MQHSFGRSAVVGFALLALSQGCANAEPNVIACTLKATDAGFSGTCAIPCLVNALAINIDGPRAGATCSEPPRTVNVMLKKTSTADRWLGTMEGKHPEDPTRFELVSGTSARTPFGWFKLETAAIRADAIEMRIDASKQLPPTKADTQIIERAKALLPNEAVWNKQDDRNCPPQPQKWSVFCALMQATEEISGGVHYRQPALQAVREVVNAVGGTRVGKHRLMDYNNHPETTLKEIHALLDQAQARLAKDLR